MTVGTVGSNKVNNGAASQERATPPSVYTVQKGDTMTGIAVNHNVSFAALKVVNPQIRNTSLIFPGDKVNIPSNQAAKYTVQHGDTLSKIATKNETTVAALDAANPQIRNINRIYPGDVLNLPAAVSKAATDKVGVCTGTPIQDITLPPTGPTDLRAMFDPAKGSSALGAIIIGNAEGTRTRTGGMTNAYEGHIDPGNGKGNRGSFSYQHGTPGMTAAQADGAQLTKLTRQISVFETAARNAGVDPSNVTAATAYLDLYNQSESAAGRFLNQIGYLNEAGISNQSVTELRFRSFVDVSTGSRFRFPSGNYVGGGFENIAQRNLGRAPTEGEVHSVIRADQARRQNAMAGAINSMDAQASSGLTSSERPVAKPTGLTSSERPVAKPADIAGAAEAIRFPSNRGLDLPPAVIRQANSLHDAVRGETGYRINVTSGYRDAGRQASAMYDNMASGKEAAYKNKAAYNEIRAAYNDGRKEGLNKAEIVADMTAVIQAQVDRGTFISRHQISKGLDISTPPKGIASDVLEAIRNHPQVDSVLREGNHYHIQFK